jgi:hypothetical protein
MAATTTEYRRLRLRRFPQVEERDTPDARYWKKFKLPVRASWSE